MKAEASFLRSKTRIAAVAAAALALQVVVAMAASAGVGHSSFDAVSLAPPIGQAARPQLPPREGKTCDSLTPRATADRPDLIAGPAVHVVYLVAADFPDEELDRSSLQCSVDAWDRWFKGASAGMAWRLDRFKWSAGGTTRRAVDITFVRSPRVGAELRSSTAVEEELARAGLSDPDKLYLSYVAADAGNLCGSGRYPLLELSDPTDPLGGHGRFAQVYLFSAKGCRGHDFGVPGAPRWVEATAIQEMLHTEGVTPFGAPHSCSGLEPLPTHVCTPGLGATEPAGLALDPERIDIMFPFVGLPLSEKVLDRDNDDYFQHSLPIRDLADSPYLTDVRNSGHRR